MSREKVLKRWQDNVQARSKWAEFLESDEFDAGIRMMEAQSDPIFIVGESSEVIAQRHAFQAGFRTALQVLSILPDLHFKKNATILPEWDHVEPEDEFND